MIQKILKSLMVAVAIIALTAPVSAQKIYDVSTSAIPGSSGTGPLEAIGQVWTFEPAEGFAPGNIDGQVGWSVFQGDVNQVISTANPASGTQNYRNNNEPGFPTLTNVGAFSPDTGPSSIQPQTLSVDVNISADGGADYDVIPQAPSQALLSARVKFSFLGDIQVLDDTGGGLAFVDTGTDWVPGAYRNLRVEMDPGANTLDYYYDNGLIYSSVAGVFAGTAMEQVVILSDNFHAGDVGDFDNLSVTVIPEPAACLMLLAGGLALLSHRVRRTRLAA